jgi:hypothetical protein
MSTLDTFQRCRKKYEYSEVRGWNPRSGSRAMEIGTLFHACLAAGYRAVREFDKSYAQFANGNWAEGDETASASRGLTFLAAATPAAFSFTHDRNGVALGLTREDRELAEDMVNYFWENMGREDLKQIREVLAVEDPGYIQIGDYLIRATFDLVAFVLDEQYPVIFDHKTVGDVKIALDFLELDFQTRTYYSAARGKYGPIGRFTHTFVNRDVPPGFGHRSLLTATGKKRPEKTLASMQDPNNYLRRSHTPLSDRQIDAFEAELIALVGEVDRATSAAYFPRTPIRGNYPGCAGCPYKAPCASELDGNEVAPAAVDLMFIVRGSEEWQALRAGKTALEAK